MFSPVQTGIRRSRAPALSVSIVLHGLFLVWLLHAPAPPFLTPSFVVRGENGKLVAHLYWPNYRPDAANDVVSTNSASTNRKLGLARARITWNSARNQPAKVEIAPSEVAAESEASSAASVPSLPAGSPNGLVLEGSLTGPDVRPALPTVSADPVVDVSELPEGMKEGDEVVEITIDARGNIVQKVVMSSLGPAIDAKVLAALEEWHFRPATRWGTPIPSKQDVHYHFPRFPKA